MTEYSAQRESCTIIESIGTANPPHAVDQADAAAFIRQTSGISESLKKRIPQILEKSGINCRYSCLADYKRHFEEFEFYPQNPTLFPAPTTGLRNKVYQQEAVPLAKQAAENCLSQADASPSEITHLIVVTCTGFFAPGIDILLVKELGLPLSTERTVLGFMGCYAAFNGLKTAAAICRSNPNARVLVVCVELCTIHFQVPNTLESVIVNALFADGAAACLLRQMPKDEAAGKLIYRTSATSLDSCSLDAMSWEIGDTGFLMGLSPKVPEIVAKNLPGFIEMICMKSGVSPLEIGFWAVHPGGRQVLDRTLSALELSTCALADSYAILRDYGNMSSPTILFIIKRLMARRVAEDYGLGIGLAFGPGLTIEGCVLEFGAEPRV